MELQQFMDGLTRRNQGQTEFLQAVAEVADKVIPYINQHPEYENAQILERLTEPDRVISFRVTWEDDAGNVRVNRGYRVQFSNAIGPYKGGLRFDKSVNLSILKFLGFEQIFKNSLTTLPLGGGKGGADFNPKGKSDREVMRFCQAYMTELARHIGRHIDVPAGDIGVGAREMGYLFGQLKKLSNEFAGTLTGKGLAYGGSHVRTEATGYGCVYMADEMMRQANDNLEGKKCLISGSGNVALYAAEKLLEFGARVMSLSDRTGTVHFPRGLTDAELSRIMIFKFEKRGSFADMPIKDWKFRAGQKPWSLPGDLVFPCATQNELDEKDARKLIKNGCRAVIEGANMPTTLTASRLFEKSGIMFMPGKAANAGGVAISGLEMAQNSMRMSWSWEEVDEKLQKIMKKIHQQCLEHGVDSNGSTNYIKGANLAGFKKVADALLAYGIV